MSGAILETWVIAEIIKSYLHHGRSPPRVYFYRDKEKREIDLLIEENGTLYPVEIKKSAAIHTMKFRGFSMLENLDTPVGHGGVICFANALNRYPIAWTRYRQGTCDRTDKRIYHQKQFKSV
ncbi:MAG: hypothetical protein FCKEOINB_02693 [Nitrosomonas sp.]|nr:hypothetical protein [Nitrosomonas sp.]